MRTQAIPLVGDSYADETRPWSQQDTMNWLPCAAEVEGTLSVATLKTPPGLRPFVEIVDAPPVRRTHNAEGKLFTVIGRNLYRISNAGVAIPVGEVPGIGRVVMAHNQISLGNEILAVNGSAGYVYNTVTDTFGRITDPGYPGSATAVFIDGYLVQIEPQGRYAFNSEPAAATQYNTLDRFTSEVSPDRLVAPAAFNNKLLLLSKTTSEFFENTGASQQPFRSTRITMDKGCAGPYAVAHADNTVFFLGSDGMFYMVDGYRPVRISKRPLEQAIRGLNWSQVFAEVWEDAGFTVVYWTFPDGRTWGFNAADRRWHRRESYGLNRWRVNSMTRWNDSWIAGDFQRGRLWEVSWDYLGLEGDQEYISERTLAVIHDDQNLVLIPRVEFVMDTGQPETVPIPFPMQPVGPTIEGDAPDGSLAIPYDTFQYTVTPGDAPIAIVAIVSGELPAGLTMSATGEVTGTPTQIVTKTFTVRATDTNGLYAEVEDTIAISAISFATIAASPGHIIASPDGITWAGDINTGLADDIVLLKALGGNVYALGDGAGRYSADSGETWSDVAGLETGDGAIRGMAYADGVWIVTYNFGDIISRSTDGATFSPVDVGTSSNHYTAAGHEDTFVVAMNNNRCRVSHDKGLTWTTELIESGLGTPLCIIYAGDMFHCEIYPGFYSSPTGDAGSWVETNSPAATATGDRCLMGLGETLVFSQAENTWTSDDHGETWTAGGGYTNDQSGGGQLNNITHNGLRFIVSVETGIDSSDDGATWIDRHDTGAGANVNVTSLGEVPA